MNKIFKNFFDVENCLVPISVELYKTANPNVFKKQIQIFGIRVVRITFVLKPASYGDMTK